MLSGFNPIPRANPEVDTERAKNYHKENSLYRHQDAYYIALKGKDVIQVDGPTLEKLVRGEEEKYRIFIRFEFLETVGESRVYWAKPSQVLEEVEPTQEKKGEAHFDVKEAHFFTHEPWEEDDILKTAPSSIGKAEMTRLQEELIAALRTSDVPLGLGAIAQRLGKKATSISARLGRLAEEGGIVKRKRNDSGLYVYYLDA